MLLALAVLAPAASAAVTHPYTGVSFGPDGVGGSESFERVQSLAVDPGNGDTYVYDGGAGKVYKFDSAGAPVDFSATGTNAIEGVGGGGGGAEFEVALAPAGSPAGTAGNIYVANNGNAIHVYSAAGTEIAVLEQGGETCGAATDPSGNFYAGIFGSTINKFTPTANPPTETDKVDTGTVEGVGLCNVAADGLGNVYAANYNGGGLYKLEGLSDASPALIDASARTMGIAPGSNDLYANRGGEVLQYDSSGNLIARFGGDELSQARGVAVNSGATKIYVGNPTAVKVFGPAATVPDATTEAADAVKRTSATLHGTVGAAGGPDATCVFQYVTELAFNFTGFEGASEAPCEPAGPFTGSSTTAVSASVTGLSLKTDYAFRLVATSSNGSYAGAAVLFKTLSAVNVTTDPASGITASEATLNGTIDPEGTELDECFFEYRRFAFGLPFEKVPCAESPAEIGAGEGPVAVHLDLTGLRGGTEYQFLLVGKNGLGTSKGSTEEFKTTGPGVLAESIADVSETGATFRATINPNGSATSFAFEYVPQSIFEQSGYATATSVPAGGESIGAGNAGVEVSAQASDLSPHTTYRFRVVATSADGVTQGASISFTTRAPAVTFGPCPNDGFRSGFGASLPDCRGYERATPADKGGLDVEGIPDLLGAAEDGSGVSFYSTAGSGTPAGGGGRQEVTTLLASRAGDSWATQRLLPPESLGEKAQYLGSSPDMRFALVEAGLRTEAGLYLIDTADESVTEVVPKAELGINEAFAYDAISADGSRLFFESRAQLTPEAIASVPNLYMWDRASGEVTSVGILPQDEGGEGAPSGSFGAAYAWQFEETWTGGGTARQYVEAIHAATANGDQIFFTAGETGQLYLRRGLAGPSPSTTRVSAPEAGVSDPNGPLPAAFQEATPDGAHGFFISSEKLTADASTGEFDGGKDLYRYDTAGDSLVDVTAGLESPENLNGARVQGLLGTSVDGTSGYFVARGKLAPGAAAGNNNIYRFEEGSGGSFQFAFVADLGKGGARNWAYSSFPGGNIATYDGKASRVSPDAGTLVYTAGEQIFVYRAGEEEAICISCDPGGTPSIGEPELTATFLNSNSGFIIPRSTPAPRLTRNLSADGSRVFFQTPNGLLGADTNGSPKCNYLVTKPLAGLHLPRCVDVYEWEAVGAPGGSCTKVEFNGGCLYLLSTGKSEDASYFIDASSDGSNAFIATTSQLVPGDRDQLYDIYDVREGGGLASQQFVPSPPCEGQACRTGAPPAPSSQSPGSASFHGSGNVKPGKQKHCHKKSKKCHKKKRRHNHKHNKKHGQARPNKGDRK